MEVRRGVLSILVVLTVAGAIACCPECLECPECPECPEQTSGMHTQYVVIVPPEEGNIQCRIVPDPRIMENAGSLTFLNLSDEQIRIELPAALTANSDPNMVFYLEKDQSTIVPLVDPKSGDYIYSIKGPTPGCLTGLPTPKIVIP